MSATTQETRPFTSRMVHVLELLLEQYEDAWLTPGRIADLLDTNEGTTAQAIDALVSLCVLSSQSYAKRLQDPVLHYDVGLEYRIDLDALARYLRALPPCNQTRGLLATVEAVLSSRS